MLRVEVVAVRHRAAGLPEDLVAAAAQHLSEEAVVRLPRDLHVRRALRSRMAQAAEDVAGLRLDQVEVRRAVVAVRPEDREEFGKPGTLTPS